MKFNLFLFLKVFKREELQMIADLCKKHDVIAVMDEVYEWIVFKGNEHLRMGMIIIIIALIL